MSSFTIRADGRSMLFGAAFATAAWFGLGALRPPPQSAQRVSLDPHPASVVRILEGQSFTVPAGKMLSVKTLGQAGGDSAGGEVVLLRINGTDALSGRTDPNPVQLSTPVVAGPGEVVAVLEQFDNPKIQVVALGYLTDL